MSDKELETTIEDGMVLGLMNNGGRVIVRISADSTREDDFDSIRVAVKEVLGDE